RSPASCALAVAATTRSKHALFSMETRPIWIVNENPLVPEPIVKKDATRCVIVHNGQTHSFLSPFYADPDRLPASIQCSVPVYRSAADDEPGGPGRRGKVEKTTAKKGERSNKAEEKRGKKKGDDGAEAEQEQVDKENKKALATSDDDG
ncbi:unnamed protein product, partial [Amoebophrya sp. A25]